MEVGESYALVVQCIQGRRLEMRIPMTLQISVALVVCQNQNDVGF